jgi:hypothetical protein
MKHDEEINMRSEGEAGNAQGLREVAVFVGDGKHGNREAHEADLCEGLSITNDPDKSVTLEDHVVRVEIRDIERARSCHKKSENQRRLHMRKTVNVKKTYILHLWTLTSFLFFFKNSKNP